MVKKFGQGGSRTPDLRIRRDTGTLSNWATYPCKEKSSNITKYFKNGGSQLLTLCELASANSLVNLGGLFVESDKDYLFTTVRSTE